MAHKTSKEEWLVNHLGNLDPVEFYKFFDYSSSLREEAENDLRKTLACIANNGKKSQERKSRRLLGSFNTLTMSRNCELYWLQLQSQALELQIKETKQIHKYNMRKHAVEGMNLAAGLANDEILEEYPSSKRPRKEEPENTTELVVNIA